MIWQCHAQLSAIGLHAQPLTMVAPQCDSNKIANMPHGFVFCIFCCYKSMLQLVPFRLWAFAAGWGSQYARMLQKEFFVIKRLL